VCVCVCVEKGGGSKRVKLVVNGLWSFSELTVKNISIMP
jgi:hypothetical protein